MIHLYRFYVQGIAFHKGCHHVAARLQACCILLYHGGDQEQSNDPYGFLWHWAREECSTPKSSISVLHNLGLEKSGLFLNCLRSSHATLLFVMPAGCVGGFMVRFDDHRLGILGPEAGRFPGQLQVRGNAVIGPLLAHTVVITPIDSSW